MLSQLMSVTQNSDLGSLDQLQGTASLALGGIDMKSSSVFDAVLEQEESASIDKLKLTELAAQIHQTVIETGEKSPLHKNSTTNFDLESMDKEGLMAYLMANSGTSVASDDLSIEDNTSQTTDFNSSLFNISGSAIGNDLEGLDDANALFGEDLLGSSSPESEFDPSQDNLLLNVPNSTLLSPLGNQNSSRDENSESDSDGSLIVAMPFISGDPLMTQNLESSTVDTDNNLTLTDIDQAPVALSPLAGSKGRQDSLSTSTVVGFEDISGRVSSTANAATLSTSAVAQASNEEGGTDQSFNELLDSDLEANLPESKSKLTQNELLNNQTVSDLEVDNDVADDALDIKTKITNDAQLSQAQKAQTQPTIELQKVQQTELLNQPMRMTNAASALSDRINSMLSNGVQHAVIRLDPPELGSMEVRVQVQQEHTHVQIVTATHQTKEALEHHAARLRESLAEQGVSLDNLDVSDQQAQSQGESAGNSRHGGSGGNQNDVDSGAMESSVVQSSISVGLVDQYV